MAQVNEGEGIQTQDLGKQIQGLCQLPVNIVGNAKSNLKTKDLNKNHHKRERERERGGEDLHGTP